MSVADSLARLRAAADDGPLDAVSVQAKLRFLHEVLGALRLVERSTPTA